MTQRRWLIPLILILATLVTFAPILRNDFVGLDDPETIRDNPHLKDFSYFWQNQAWGLYVPLTYTFWSVLALGANRSGTMSPVVFHAASLGIHVFSVLVVYGILRRLLPPPLVLRGRAGVGACIGALLFALHPLQVETVAWASGAKDLLGGLFALIVIHQYLKWLESKSGRNYAVAILALVAGMLCKPITVVAPIIAGLIDVALVRHNWRAGAKSIAPLVLLTIPCIIWSRAVQTIWPQTITALWIRPFIAADALAFYLVKILWPVGLTSFYGRTPQAVIDSQPFYLSWIVPVGLTVILMLNRKRLPAALVGFGTFVIGLLPVLGLMPFMYQLHSTVADHYMYLPMFGVALAVASIVSIRPTPAVIGVSAALLVLLGVLSFLQTRWWRDDIAFSQRGVDLYPQSVDAHASMGRALASAGLVEDAIPHFRYVASARPTSAIAHTLLGRALAASGHLLEAEHEFSTAVQLNPNDRSVLDERDGMRARLPAPATSPAP